MKIRNMFKKTIIAGGVLLLLNSTSYAACDRCVMGAVNNLNSSITTQIQSLNAQVINAIGASSKANELTQKAVATMSKEREEASYQRDVARSSVERDNQAKVDTAPSLNGCIERTSGQLGVGVGVAGGSGSGFRSVVQRARNNVAGNIDNFGTKLRNHVEDIDLCSALDVNRKDARKNNCTVIGIKENADFKVGSIFSAAGTGETVVRNRQGNIIDPRRESPNFSMDVRDQIIANKAISNIVTGGDKPLLLPASVEGTPAGRDYLAMARVHETRMTTALSALSDISDKRAQPKNLDQTATEAWRTKQEAFRELFPNRQFPEKPSVYEFMNLRVNEPNTKVYQDVLKQVGGEELMRASIRRSDLNTQISWMVYQQLERLTAINAAALAANLEPITKEMLDASHQSALAGGN